MVAKLKVQLPDEEFLFLPPAQPWTSHYDVFVFLRTLLALEEEL
jgi:hypothetical protein